MPSAQTLLKLTAVALGFLVVWGVNTWADDPIAEETSNGARIPAKLPTYKPYMQAKLTQSQRILEGLVISDFDQVQMASKKLMLNSLKSPQKAIGDEVDDKVYDHFATEFLRLSSKLGTMAEERNLEGATLTYQQLTATCIACHEHLRDSSK